MIRFRAVREIWGSQGDLEGQWLSRMVDMDTKEELLGYEVISGLSILYVRPNVFQQGLQDGLIEPLGGTLPKLRFEDVWRTSGMRRCISLSQTLLEATPQLLAKGLQQAASGAEGIRVRVYDAFYQRNRERETGKEQGPYLMEEFLLDPVAFQVLERYTAPEEQCLAQCYFCSFDREMGYIECVERLAQRAYRHYMNVEDLYRVYGENDFYDMDRFCQRLLRLEFEFIKR